MRSLSFSPDSRYLVTGADDGQLKYFDAIGGQHVGTLHGHASWVLGVDYNPADGRRCVSSSSDGTVKIWDVGQRQCVHTFSGHVGQVWDVAYDWTGSRVVSVGEDKTVRVHEAHG